MVFADHFGDSSQLCVLQHARMGDLAWNVRQHFAAVLIGTQGARSAAEAGPLEVAQQVVHCRRPGSSASMNCAPDAQYLPGHVPARQ